MRYWEFLIQQEGDQTWLPLETRQVEILEGRYRMAAYTSYDDTSVEVRVSQLLLDEMPPRRRVRKRRSVTNDAGLLAIFPFMQLNPGRWEIDCNSPDVIDDFLGESWHYSVQLQVTPRDEDEWDSDWADAEMASDSSQPVTTEAVSKSPTSTLPTDDTSDIADLHLELKQQAYVTELGQELTLTGHLDAPAEGFLADGRLWTELRDPQTANLLKETSFRLPAQQLPATFSVTFTLPDTLSTQVILGAISWRAAHSHPDAISPTSASFTITVGLAQMLDTIANQPDLEFEEENSIFTGSTEAFVPPPEKTEALIARDIPVIPKELIPSAGLTLPPQIKPPSETDTSVERQPELPEFPAVADGSRQEPVAKSDTPESVEAADDQAIPEEPPLAETAETLDDDVTNIEVSEQEPEEQPPFAAPNVFEFGTANDDLDLELAAAAEAENIRDDDIRDDGVARLDPKAVANRGAVYGRHQPTDIHWEPAALNVDRAFEKLQLQERFWQKLTLLTQDGYRQSLEVKRALKTSDTLPEGNQQSNEFVVYEPPPVKQRFDPSKPPDPADDPVQVLPPSLDVPLKELVAGEWIAIRVRVPAADYQPYVKVWMNDLQTRTVIEAPRMLMQFTPNDFNELETLMRVQVPGGCLELQFAAIAVDMSTLQESRKVVQNRRVMPPDNTLSIFDDWDL